jgi:hypothetical protein
MLQSTRWRLLVQLDPLRLADHSHERSDPLRQLRSDIACWSTAAARAIRIRRALSTRNRLAARGLANLNLTREISSP